MKMAENITLQKFQRFIDSFPLEFERVKFGKQYVYQVDLDEYKSRTFLLQVLSSVDTRSLESRYKGVDSIQVRIITGEGETAVKSTHTKRTSGWEGRVREKIRELYKNYPDNIRECEECERIMFVRNSSDGEFYGCSGWTPNNPLCRNTEPFSH